MKEYIERDAGERKKLHMDGNTHGNSILDADSALEIE
jgi:hypothetical protein